MTIEIDQTYSFANLTRQEAAVIAAIVGNLPSGQAHQLGVGSLFPKLDAQMREQDARNAPEIAAQPIAVPQVDVPTGRRKRAEGGPEHNPGIPVGRPSKRARKR